MTRDEAKAHLATLVQSGVDPCLEDPELDMVLAQNACADAEDRAPSDTAWLPTYDFPAAAMDGWLLKAAKASQLHNVTMAGGRTFAASQIFDHCQAMAEMYRKRKAATV